jgi:hypothetical protein
MGRFQSFIRFVGGAVQAISVVRAPLLASLFGAFVLSFPDQTREIYRVLAHDYHSRLVQVWITFGAMLICAYALWRISWQLLQQNEQVNARITAAGIVVLPAVCGMLLPLGAAYGLQHSIAELGPPVVDVERLQKLPQLLDFFDSENASDARLLNATLVCLVIAFLIVALHLITTVRKWRGYGKSAPSKLGIFGVPSRIFFFIFLLASVLLYSVGPIDIPQHVGSLTIFFQFLIILSFFASLLTIFSDRHHIPLMTALFLIAVLFSAFDINDNHIIHTFERTPKKLQGPATAFWDWYEARADRSYYEEKHEPYPVFLVSAAGGGLYAASFTAKVLGRLQDRCPNFAQHVFAISGVSGGSLGAAVFAGLAKSFAANAPRQDCNLGQLKETPFESSAKAVLARDFLAPVIAAGLFPDFLQRFIPIRIERFDRARALDQAFRTAWQRGASNATSNFFSSPFLDSWQPKDAAPALFLNSTDANYGYRVLMSPFHVMLPFEPVLDSPELTGIAEFHNTLDPNYFKNQTHPDEVDPNDLLKIKLFTLDVDVATAVGVSARFPWVMPAASVVVGDTKERLVDGGYYENSGLDTLLALLSQLEPFEQPQKEGEEKEGKNFPYVRFNILAITGLKALDPVGWQGMAELLSPIRAMLSTRERRAQLVLLRALREREKQKCETERAPYEPAIECVQLFSINHRGLQLPLGWVLSDATQRLLDLYGGEPGRFVEEHGKLFDFRGADDRGLRFINLNDGSACAVLRLLEPKIDTGDCWKIPYPRLRQQY